MGAVSVGAKQASWGHTMNATKAKAIRKQVYGDLSRKADRQYLRASFGTIINHPNSLRAQYQQAKRIGRRPQC